MLCGAIRNNAKGSTAVLVCNARVSFAPAEQKKISPKRDFVWVRASVKR